MGVAPRPGMIVPRSSPACCSPPLTTSVSTASRCRRFRSCSACWRGLFFAAVFLYRGFGIAAGSHAAYDILAWFSVRTCSLAPRIVGPAAAPGLPTIETGIYNASQKERIKNAMPYFPNTESDRRAMLDAIGATSIDELFAMIPAECGSRRELCVPPGLGELELTAHLAEFWPPRNTPAVETACFSRRQLRPFHSRRGRHGGRPQRVLHRLYALPARASQGSLQGVLRVPDAGSRN